jgi:hypothetical protein
LAGVILTIARLGQGDCGEYQDYRRSALAEVSAQQQTGVYDLYTESDSVEMQAAQGAFLEEMGVYTNTIQ